MFLKEVIIDGFKSYAQRTVVKDFDPAFNAITGLNGSGKSNVLDSICFVLGITNLSQVRASSLQELVYKGGQGGVSKASVTLIFDNTDKSTAPVGYEQPAEITVMRQIVIGGRNKYLINGINAQPGRVQNLFHSVGLNVNNPHFLIMQGRITKVINMKPPEVLSMIEEAAGTKMYENKKEAALKTIEKKERKVEEINSLLEEKINPSLAKLERERKHYMEWNQNNNEIEALKRFIIAYEYMVNSKLLEKSSGEGSELADRVTVIDASVVELKAHLKQAKKILDRLMKERSERLSVGDLDGKQHAVEEISKSIVKKNSVWANQKEALQSEISILEGLDKSIAAHEKSLESLASEMTKVDADVEVAKTSFEKATTDIEQAETALLTGASSQGMQSSGTGSAIDQLEAARRAVSTAQTQIASLKLQEKHVSAELKVKAEMLSRDRANVRSLEAEKKKAEKAISDAKLAVHELDFDSSASEVLNSKLGEEREKVATLRETVDQLAARLASCDFTFSDPHPNFNRRKVHGLVARLVQVKDSAWTTAIEVTAGGRLYQVVVDTDSTANDLLRRGKLARRVTILPLNKIRHEVLHRSKLQNAKNIEPRTELALSLVGYDQDVANAMEHVFGRTLICPDMDSAKRVTFDNRVRTRTVTMEGDTYDPSGTASGGSSSRQGPSVLTLLAQLKDAEAELNVRQGNLQRLSTQAQQCDVKGRQHRQLLATLEVRQDEATLLEKRLAETATGRLLSEVDQLKLKLNEEIPNALKEAQATLTHETEKVKELEYSMQDSEAAKKRAEKEAEAAMKAVREAHSKAMCKLQKLKDRQSSLSVEIETAEDEIKRLEEQKNDVSLPAVAKLKKEVATIENEVARTKVQYEEAERALKEEQERLVSSSQAVSDAQNKHEELAEKLETLSLEKTKLESKLRESERGRAAAEKLVSELDKKYTWIAQESDKFGVEGSEYEFSKEALTDRRKKLGALQTRQEGLSKKINKKAMHMFETAKEEYRSLMTKKGIIEEDKEKIEMVIAGLDEKKMVAVEKTWRKVNADFGSIFSDLLPGTSAKLEPPSGMSVEDGLEIRVAFGTVWKDSLSELSGGQRSLIALSLILAMLRFKPAPMYILDEVDAALDLSHTQNIGRMLSRHFTGSQFIVVSLKEGMFSNANVIFRTKFVEGISTIKRTENDLARREVGKQRTGNIASAGDMDKENVENDSSPALLGRKRKTVR